MSTPALDPTFENLLKLSLQRQYQPSTFVKLYRDFQKKYPNRDTEKSSISPLYINIEENYLQRDYIYEILVGSDLENTFTQFTDYFSTVSNKLSIKDQMEVLLFINQINEKFPWKNYATDFQVLNSLSAYSKYLTDKYNESEEFTKLTVFYVKLLTNIFKVSKEIKLNENFIQSTTEFSEWLFFKSLTEPYRLLNNYLSEYAISSVKFGFNDASNLKTDDSTHKKKIITEKESLKLLKIKKIIWLSQKLAVEFTKLDDQFIIDFKELLNLSSVTTVESISTLSTELLSGILQCFQLSSSNNKHIWKEYLVCKIPWFLKHTLEISKSKLEKVIETLMHDYDPIIFVDNKEVLLEFDRHLVELELLRPGTFKTLNNPLISNDDKSQIYTMDDLNHNYTHKFIECNPEFTSIEEIGIVDFVNKTNNSIKSKHKFCELVMESFNSFMLTGDTLRLRRLLISLSINFDILDNLLLSDSPYKVLIPLLKFLEKQVVQTPESIGMNTAERYLNQSNQPDLLMDLDIAGDDSSNAQDFFSDLSTILVFCQFIITRYNLILNDPSFSSMPNTISLLKNSKLIIDKSNSTSTIEEVTLDDDTINKWISSMFDPSNVDGISDSLIKGNTPLEYSLLIPRIVREALVCNSLGWLDDDALMGGLEYLHQKFLVGWMVYVIEEICNLKWFNNGKDSNLDSIIEKVSKQLLVTSDSENIDIQVIIKLARYTVSDKIHASFPNVDLSLVKPSKTLTTLENFTNLVKFASVTDKDDDTEKFEFELTQIWATLLSKDLVVDYLYQKLNILINNSQLLSDLSYELISDILITFCKWKVGNSINSTWPTSLSQLKDTALHDIRNFTIIFNRKPTKITVKGYKAKDTTKAEDEACKIESGFFGFIQEPKSSDESDSNMMDVDQETVTDKGIDIYGENLLVVAFENRGNSVTESFLHSILDHLS